MSKATSSLERNFRLHPAGKEEDLDYFSLLSLFFGLAGLFLKVRVRELRDDALHRLPSKMPIIGG